MLYAHVSPEAQEKLTEELNTATEIGWYRRLRVIQLSAQRQPVALIATFLDLCPATDLHWLTD